ncbi:MAG: hypothetical protein IPP42_06940 [Saprospiraceae bacterium]|nr:hypothetical protein [Saprospiraceae bacterium]
MNTPVAYFALWGKGYLSPLGLVTIMLVLSQILGALGVGQYFPGRCLAYTAVVEAQRIDHS